MVTYEDILYPLNLGYGLREIYDIAPWAFDLLIFALVLSAIFKPVMEKLPIFASKKDESHKLAGILALVFSGSTVYWMQVQNTNLMNASAYLILILFAVLGIFVYSLISSTMWGAKHKVVSGVIAFFLTAGLCQALFGVGSIFMDVFPIFTALFVFFANILLWVVLITALILLIGRAWSGKGEGPSGTQPSSEGRPGFWKKAKGWIPQTLRSPKAKKELDLKAYKKIVGNVELKIDETNKFAQEFSNLLQFQSSLMRKLGEFFKNLPVWLDAIEVYFSKHGVLERKPLNDVARWNDLITEAIDALNVTAPAIKAEFDKLEQSKNNMQTDINDFEGELNNVLSWTKDCHDSLSFYTESFREKRDEGALKKVAATLKLVSDIESKAGKLTILNRTLTQEFDNSKKILPTSLGVDFVEKNNSLKDDLKKIFAVSDTLTSNANQVDFSKKVNSLRKLVDTAKGGVSSSDKTIKDAEARSKKFLEINAEMNNSIGGIRTSIEELRILIVSIREGFDSLAVLQSAEEKHKKNNFII